MTKYLKDENLYYVEDILMPTAEGGLAQVFHVDMKEITTQGTSSTKMEDNDEF